MGILNSVLTFDPICTPWSRKEETVGILVWGLMIWFLPSIGVWLTLYICFCTQYWYIVAVYITWVYSDVDVGRRGGRRWSCRWRLPFPKWYGRYFPLSLVKTVDLDPSRNYLAACHPHGILVTGVTGTLVTDGTDAHLVFPGLKTNFFTFDLLFFVPIFREILLFLGGCSVNAESISVVLQKEGGGNLAIILPGGAREAILSRPGTNKVYLRKRKGFIRVAIQNGAPVVPVYSFRETETYSQVLNPERPWARAIQETCVKWSGLPFPLWYGRGILQNGFGILPRRHPITTVVGSPIEVVQQSHPTAEYIDQVHAQYIDELCNLYYTHRQKYGDVNSELEIN